MLGCVRHLLSVSKSSFQAAPVSSNNSWGKDPEGLGGVGPGVAGPLSGRPGRAWPGTRGPDTAILPEGGRAGAGPVGSGGRLIGDKLDMLARFSKSSFFRMFCSFRCSGVGTPSLLFINLVIHVFTNSYSNSAHFRHHIPADQGL